MPLCGFMEKSTDKYIDLIANVYTYNKKKKKKKLTLDSSKNLFIVGAAINSP